MNRFFDPELESYRSQIVRMLLLTHQQLQLAVGALLEYDKEKAQKVLEIEKSVDRLEIEVDSEAVRFLTIHSPKAADLRLILAGSRMSHEFERVGDEAKKIAQRSLRQKGAHPEGYAEKLNQMFEIADSMFSDLNTTFNSASAELAQDIIARDSKIDRINKEIGTMLMDSLEVDQLLVKSGVDLLACSRAIERIGDHAQNVAEGLIFLITGQDVREGELGE